jgi:uncharacterized protein YodC (DUF2158 family)
MEHDFKPGDVVQLKSGGPKMTIKGIGKYGFAASEDNACCVWFEKTTRKEEIFELATITKA